MTLIIAMLPAGSPAVMGKEALPHFNDPPVRVVAHVRLLARIHDVSFVEFHHLGRVPGMLVLVAEILHVSVVGVNDRLSEVNQSVLLMLLASLDLILALDVHKILAGDA